MNLADELAHWPAGAAGAAVIGPEGALAVADPGGPLAWASVTKVVTSLTVLTLVGAGDVGLDEPCGPCGSTLRHLLAHASGLAADADRVLAPPGRRRIYSNRGIEVAAEHVAARVGRPFAGLVSEHLLDPLGMEGTTLVGSPAHGMRGPLTDLVLLAHELLVPRLLDPDLVPLLSTVAFPGLAGVLPGFGRQEPNDWGLGAEVRGSKAPHWTAPSNSSRTFGHFGQSGCFLWVDPARALACASVSDRPFGPWAAAAWPVLSQRVLEAFGRPSPERTSGRDGSGGAPT